MMYPDRAFPRTPAGRLALAVAGVLAALAIPACSSDSQESRPAMRSTTDRPAASGLFFRAMTDAAGTHRYALYIPPPEIARPPYPLVVFLHGYGECGTDGVKQTSVGLLPHVLNAPERWPCVILMPQKPEFDPLWATQFEVVMSEINFVRSEMAIDASHIALTGLSQGGNGTWMFASRSPETWSAIAPICGFHRDVPVGQIAANLRGLPVWAFHGLKDDVVRPQETRDLVAAVRATGSTADIRLTEFPEANHNSWDPAYHDPELARWLLSQRRAAK